MRDSVPELIGVRLKEREIPHIITLEIDPKTLNYFNVTIQVPGDFVVQLNREYTDIFHYDPKETFRFPAQEEITSFFMAVSSLGLSGADANRYEYIRVWVNPNQPESRH
jgi:hypothetical protein